MDKEKEKSFWARHPIITGILIFFVLPLVFVPFVDDNPGQNVGEERSNREPTAAERREDAKRAFEQRALSHVVDVIESDRMGHMKRSILVKLDQEVSMAELEVIGRMLHAQEPAFQRTFIEYLLPGMQAGSGAWATTHFDPDLKVVLSGFEWIFAKSSGARCAAKSDSDHRRRLASSGRWLRHHHPKRGQSVGPHQNLFRWR